MIDERCGGGFSVTARDADDPAVAFVAVSQFYLADHRDTFGPDSFYPFIFFGYARTFHHLIGLQDFVFTVAAFFVLNSIAIQHGFVFGSDGTAITHKHIPPLLLSQYGCTHTAFSGTQYDHSFCHQDNSIIYFPVNLFHD